MTKETVNKAPSGRPSRKPVGFRNRLSVRNQDPNYVYRWVNDKANGGDRVEILKEAGYEPVQKGTHRTDTGRVEGTPTGGPEAIPGGGGDTLILMRQKREWYEEDQKAKQARVDELDRAQKRTPEGFYGKITEEKL